MNAAARVPPVTRLPLVTFVASAWLGAALFYRDLPTLVPTHFNVFFKANGFTAKPWGPFVLPLTMTAVWLGRSVIRRLSLPRYRIERFPGAFDFRIMLTIAVVFLIWSLVVAQSVSWLRVAAIPSSVALIVAGGFVSTLPFGAVRNLPSVPFAATEGEWLRARRFAVPLFIAVGASMLAIVALT